MLRLCVSCKSARVHTRNLLKNKEQEWNTWSTVPRHHLEGQRANGRSVQISLPLLPAVVAVEASSWQRRGGGSKTASSAPARCFQLLSVALRDGPAPKGHAALPSVFPFWFSERLWRPFTGTKRVFQMLVTSEQSQSISGADYPPFQRSGAARRQPSPNLLFTGVIDHASSLHSLKGAPALPRYITVWDKNGYCSPIDFWGFIFCWEYKGWCKLAFSINSLVFSLIQKVTDPLLTRAHVCFACKSYLLTPLHYRVIL